MGLLLSVLPPILGNMNPPYDETNPDRWLLGAYVGTDYHVILEISDHTSLDAVKLASEFSDERGNADLWKLFGSPIETRDVTPWKLRSNNKDAAEAVTEFFTDEVCLTEFIAYMKANPNLRGKLYYENRDIEGSVIFSEFIPGMMEDRRLRSWKNEKTAGGPVPYDEYKHIEDDNA